MHRFIYLFFGLFIASISYGQQTFSLMDAIKYGLSKNYQIQIADKNLEVAKRNNSLANAGLLPNISLNTSNGNVLGQNSNRASFVGQLSDGAMTLNNSVRNSVDLNWTLFNGFDVWISKSKFDLLEDQTKGNKEIVIENTIQAIILAYNGILIEEKRLATIKEMMGINFSRYHQAKMNKELGLISSFELMQVKNAFLLDSANMIRQAYQLEQSKNQFKLLLTIDPEEKVYLTDTLSLKDEDYDFKALEVAMNRSNRNLQNQYLNQMIFKKDIQLLQATRMPSLRMNVGNNYSWNRFDLPGVTSTSVELPITGSAIDYYVNFTLSFNVFNGHQLRRSIANTKVNEQIALLSIDEVKTQLKNELYNQYQSYKSKLDLLALNKEIRENAKANLTIAKEKWDNGTLTSIEFDSIQNDFNQADQNYIIAKYEVMAVQLELSRLTGGLITAND